MFLQQNISPAEHLHKRRRRSPAGAGRLRGARCAVRGGRRRSAERAWADRDLEERLTAWQQQLDEAANWPEGARDDQGRGWEALSRDLAWALAVWAHTPWMPLNRAAARQNFHEMLPSQMAAHRSVRGQVDPGAAGEGG